MLFRSVSQSRYTHLFPSHDRPGDEPNLTIHSYVIYPEGNTPFDLKKVKKLNPKLDQQIRDALLELDDADLIYDER